MSASPLARIYKLKVVIVAILVAGGGVGTMLLANWLEENQLAPHFVVAVLNGLADAFLVAGLIGAAIDFWTQRDKDARDDARIRRLLDESAVPIKDAVVKGFAVEREDLKRVATPELLDSIATNVLDLRLGDRTFASEVYADIRDQAIRAPERWHDVDVSIRLSDASERSTVGAPRFDVTVTWEYTVVPSHSIQRFACVSDRDEFHDLATDIPATSAWFMTPRPGFDASDKGGFELLEYSVDGERRAIRRTARKTGQTYSVAIGDEIVAAGQPVKIRYVYRTITPQAGHLLYIDIEQPTRGIKVDLEYSATAISHVSVLDLIASTKKTRIVHAPLSVPGKSVAIDFDGWAFPRTGFAFVWTLDSEAESIRSKRRSVSTRNKI